MMRPASTLPFLFLAFQFACNDGQNATSSSAFYAEPEAFVFAKQEMGQTELRQVEIRNRGRLDLKILNIRLDDQSSAQEFELLQRDGDAWVETSGSATLKPEDDLLILAVRYQPKDDQPDRAFVRMNTNDPDAMDVSLPITTGGQGAELYVDPKTLNFGAVNAGETASRSLTLMNLGLTPLMIDDLSINGSQDFHLIDGGVPIEIEKDQTHELTVQYAPLTQGADTGELLISSNDPLQPLFSVSLMANGAAACLRVPSELDFGSGLISELVDPSIQVPVNQRLLSVSSCGTAPLRIDRLTLTDPSHVFSLLDLPSGSPVATLPAASQSEPSKEFVIGFSPVMEQSYGATLKIESNDPLSPHQVTLFGHGSRNACPIPQVTQSQLDVAPLDVVTLDASPSFDPGGQVVRYVWSVISRPEGSVSQIVESFSDPNRLADGGPEDDQATPAALFFVDLAGDYTIELTVYDQLGQVSCEPQSKALVEIHAVPQKDLHIQLVWSTPSDPDETDRFGTDLDLHLRHQNAGTSWNTAAGAWDCYFGNPNPDWGIIGEVSDNPTLDIDDTNGAGPENINLAAPETGNVYDVGVLYFRAESTFGLSDADPRTVHTSYATVRIFVHGSMIAEYVAEPLTEARQLWWATRLQWCEDPIRCPTIEEQNILLSESEYAE